MSSSQSPSLYLKRLRLQNFRLYEEALFEFSPQVNGIWGDNAQGKTALLEAIYLLMLGRSFRTHQQADLVRNQSSFFSLEAHFVKQGVEQSLQIVSNGKERKIFYNRSELTSSTHLLGLISGVLIAPDDDLIQGPPYTRRLFLDLQIAQADPLYIHHLTRYNRAMKQRNQLLRTKNLVTIDSWEQEMALSASYITQKRYLAVREIEEISQTLFPLLSGGIESLSLSYRTKAHQPSRPEIVQEYYLMEFQKNREKEMALGNTLQGPHRDDLEIFLDQQESRAFGSEGQKRLCVNTLRLASWERLKKITQESPLLLLDDLGICLDERRREKLMEHLATLGQVFVTTTDCPLLKKASLTLQIKKGSLV